MNNKYKFVKNYIYNTAYQSLILIAPLITTPYISRILGASGVGIFSYAQSISAYFVLTGAVGTSLYGQREIAYVQDKEEERIKVFWEIILLRFITVIFSAIIYWMSFCRRGEYLSVYRILILEIIATAFDITWYFIGLEDFKVIVIRNIIIKLIGVVLVFTFVKEAQDVPLYTLCMTVPILLGNISLWVGSKNKIIKYHKKIGNIFIGIPRHIKPILLLFVPQVAQEVYLFLDKTMIGILGTDISQVGYYSQAQKIIKILLMIVTSLGNVMLPSMAAAFSRGDNEITKKIIKYSLQLNLMLSFGLMFGICAISPKFVPVFFGSGYNSVIRLMILISPILVIISISNVIGKQYLLPMKQEKAYTVSIISGAITNFFLNIILINYYDAIGASIASVLAEIMVTLVQCWYIHRKISILNYLKPCFKYLVLGLIMYLIVTYIGSLIGNNIVSIFIMIASGILIYCLGLIIAKDDLIAIGKLFFLTTRK